MYIVGIFIMRMIAINMKNVLGLKIFIVTIMMHMGIVLVAIQNSIVMEEMFI